ncbi:MAG: DUF983 domain-containing protein [Pseudorhodoplanes sp.]|uniref:DUF983 domain-containing protein n=1 Tax=Pseudorhodoplanes sp. TaxID=1934341 RepID=UPI003D107610
MTDTTALPPRDGWLAIRRGLSNRCPSCGRGRMFRALLKVNDHCPACNEALHHHRADDFPAYLNIVLVGHIVVPLVLAVEMAFAPPYWMHAAIWLPLTLSLAFALMHPIKGAVVAWQWAMRMHGFDPEGDKSDPLPAATTPRCAN